MADNPASLNEMSRRDLAELARSLGVPDAEVMTRAELRAAIENSRTALRPAHAGRPTTWLGVARGLIASIVEQGLNLPDAAALIRGRAPLGTPKPPPPVATVTLARIYAAQGHIQRAISTLAEVLRTDPDHEIARALRDELMGRSGLRDSGLRDSGLRDSNTRDIGQREPGVHENGVHENGLRENGLREMSAEESRTPTPTRSSTEEAPSADSAPDTERPAPTPSGEGESPSAAPATIVAEPPRSLGAAIPASEAATPMSSAPATIQTEPPAPVSDEPASPWVAHDAEPAASAAEAAAPSTVEPSTVEPSVVEPSVEPSARTLQDLPLQGTAPGVPSEVASDPRAARERESPAADALPFEPNAAPSSAAFEGPPSGPEASASGPASAPSRRQRALAPAPTPASVVVLATAGTPRYVYWELPGEGGNGSVAAEHELLLVAHVPSAEGALRHERRERIHARSGALRVSGLPEGTVLRALLVHAPSGAAARPIGVAGVVRLDETESDVQSVAFCPSRLSNPADLAIVALDHLASARVLEW